MLSSVYAIYLPINEGKPHSSNGEGSCSEVLPEGSWETDSNRNRSNKNNNFWQRGFTNITFGNFNGSRFLNCQWYYYGYGQSNRVTHLRKARNVWNMVRGIALQCCKDYNILPDLWVVPRLCISKLLEMFCQGVTTLKPVPHSNSFMTSQALGNKQSHQVELGCIWTMIFRMTWSRWWVNMVTVVSAGRGQGQNPKPYPLVSRATLSRESGLRVRVCQN